MPVSSECLVLFKKMIKQYQQIAEQSAPKLDKNYQQIYSRLNGILMAVTINPEAYNDSNIISCLSYSALLLQDASQFHHCCRDFLLSYQQETNSFDLLVDNELNIKNELESWPQTIEENTPPSISYSPFFKELQEAIAARKQRLENTKHESTKEHAPHNF